jgi:cytosine/adenosine deaminase-related metal-dependent hydrolase
MLRLATIDGARVRHLEDEIGTLTPGKQADIVSSTSDPRTSTGSAIRSPSWSSERVPPTLRR